MRYPVILPRVWLLVAVFQGASTDWRHRPHDLESIVYARGGFSDERRRAADDARQRFADIVPPTMLKLYTDQETRGARLSNSIVRSFYSQGSYNRSYPVTSEQLKGKSLTQHVTCVYFNVSDIPSSETTHRAELNLYVEFDAGNQSSTMLVTVYRATRPLPGHVCRVDDVAVRAGHLRFVGQRTVAVPRRQGSDGRWTTLVVSRAVSRWRRRPEKNFGLVVVWTKVDGSPMSSVVDRRRAYLVTYGNDRASSPAELITALRTLPPSMTTTAKARSEGEQRRRRHTKRSRRSRPRRGRKHRRWRRNLCRRRSMYVDFGEIGWDDWIVAPPGYEAFYCAGDCPFYLPDYLNTTNHAIVQSLIHSVDSRLAPRPCCVPTEMSPMSMLYVDSGDKVVLKNYQEMVVEACGCR